MNKIIIIGVVLAIILVIAGYFAFFAEKKGGNIVSGPLDFPVDSPAPPSTNDPGQNSTPVGPKPSPDVIITPPGSTVPTAPPSQPPAVPGAPVPPQSNKTYRQLGYSCLDGGIIKMTEDDITCAAEGGQCIMDCAKIEDVAGPEFISCGLNQFIDSSSFCYNVAQKTGFDLSGQPGQKFTISGDLIVPSGAARIGQWAFVDPGDGTNFLINKVGGPGVIINSSADLFVKNVFAGHNTAGLGQFFKADTSVLHVTGKLVIGAWTIVTTLGSLRISRSGGRQLTIKPDEVIPNRIFTQDLGVTGQFVGDGDPGPVVAIPNKKINGVVNGPIVVKGVLSVPGPIRVGDYIIGQVDQSHLYISKPGQPGIILRADSSIFAAKITTLVK